MALTDNLEGYWKLDESSGNATDSGGNGYTLTNSNVTYSTGKIDNGAVYNSTSDRLYSTTSDFDYQPTDAFSVSCWFNISSVTGNRFMISNQQNGGDFPGWTVGNLDGKCFFDMVQDLSPVSYLGQRSTSVEFSVDTWHHFVMTKDATDDASGVTFYVDGTSVATTAVLDNLSGTITYNSDFQLGNRASAYDMSGTLDEVGVWSREITSAEVTELYNGGSGLTYPFVADTFLPKIMWFN